jgi:hypothetical protein
MSRYVVEAYSDDCLVTADHWSAKRAFADAVEWRLVRRLNGVTIRDGGKRYSISEFAAAMAQEECAEADRASASAASSPNIGIVS